MDENKTEGTFRDVAGKVQDAVGGLTGDAATQAKGKYNQAAGQAQSYYGDTMDSVRDFAADQPVTGLLIAAGVGLLVGFLIGRR